MTQYSLIEEQTSEVRQREYFTGSFKEAKRTAARLQLWQGTTLRIEDDRRRILARKPWGGNWENSSAAVRRGLCTKAHFEG